MEFQRCKGARDMSPEDMKRFHLIEEAFRSNCLSRGYEEVKTPVIEYLHLFTSAGTLTPTMLGRVYSFLDWDGWSGERVVLRPDVTIPVARFYIESMADRELARLFYVANVFSFEESAEKTREKWQCGAELIGRGSPLADVELISLALEVLRKLRIEGVELKLSHAGLIKGLLRGLGLNQEERGRIFDQILDGNAQVLERIKAEKPGLARVLSPWMDMNGKSAGFIKNLKSVFLSDLPELEPQINDFASIAGLLQSLGYDYRIDMASVRGFEYYTGVMFQLFRGGEKIGGGGRYDDLIPSMGGKETPACGFALYLDRMMNLVKPESYARTPAEKILLKIEPATIKSGFEVAGRLRESGFIAEMYLGGKQADDFRWLLEVNSEPPLFVLTDRKMHTRHEAQTADDVLALLGCSEGG